MRVFMDEWGSIPEWSNVVIGFRFAEVFGKPI